MICMFCIYVLYCSYRLCWFLLYVGVFLCGDTSSKCWTCLGMVPNISREFQGLLLGFFPDMGLYAHMHMHPIKGTRQFWMRKLDTESLRSYRFPLRFGCFFHDFPRQSLRKSRPWSSFTGFLLYSWRVCLQAVPIFFEDAHDFLRSANMFVVVVIHFLRILLHVLKMFLYCSGKFPDMFGGISGNISFTSPEYFSDIRHNMSRA